MPDPSGEGPRAYGQTRGSSLAERLSHALNRLSWRTPIHRLRLRGRYPLQLLDVPADPIPGSPRAGRALLDRRLLFAGESVSFDALDRGGFSPAFADYFQSFAWLRDLAAVADRRQGAPIAEALMQGWLTAHARTVTMPAWRPDLWGRRILFWAAYAPYILGSRDADYRKEVLNAMARGARHLDRTADGATQGLPRVAAWAGTVAAGLLIPGGDLRTAHGEAGLARALGLAMHEDGGLISRVPVDQLGLVELLVQLRCVYEVRARPPAGAISRAIQQAVPALMSVTLGDGALSSWNGGGPASPARIAATLAASGARAVSRDDTRDWGFQRLVCGNARLVMDAAPPPVAALAQGGGASTLAFELSDGDQRLVVNCGAGPALPRELAQALRTTAAHSTLTLSDLNSTALHPDGAMGKGVTAVELARSETEAGARIEVAHDGYAKRLGFQHRRRLLLAADGRALEGEDRVVAVGRRRPGNATPFALRFHLFPDIETVLTADGQGALLRPADGPPWQFRTRAGTLALEDSLWVDAVGRPRPAKALVVSGEVPIAGLAIPWSFKRAGV
ncbi:heparinase II/III family protein [Sphingomonas nostoxanthinifaciens]|uniref:heparinase II/III family protein n=1 Tax=Sphingomonas nostoxanthinifaciens TaxID=2872652 RepID=UPI001CC20FF4|nr:heparinase II/III family protein [Sphingomonas nostoxanthinifaciens]UAK24542.1 heparinase II/III family protein [Sphingomonas nostoxanthinifaciens]